MNDTTKIGVIIAICKSVYDIFKINPDQLQYVIRQVAHFLE